MRNTALEEEVRPNIEMKDQELQKLFSQQDTNPLEALFGHSLSSVNTLRQGLNTTAANSTRLIDAMTAMEGHSIDELAAVAHLENIRGISITAEHLKAQALRQAREYEQADFEKALQKPNNLKAYEAHYGTNDPAKMARRQAYANHIQNLLDLGWTVDDIKEQIDNRKNWDTFTPHPTKDKNEAGQTLMHKSAYGSEEEAQQALEGALKEGLTPRVKDELQDETNTGLSVLDTYMDGALDYLQDMQWALDTTLEKSTFDLRDTRIDIAPRDWYAGDADGKLVPAAVLFAKRLQGAQWGAEKYLSILNDVPEGERGPLQDTITAFEELQTRLLAIESNPDNLKDKEKLAEEVAKFSAAFSDSGFKGLEDQQNHGAKWTGEIMESLREVSANKKNSQAVRDAAERATLMHKQVGVALGRQEIRHSGDDFNQIFDNLFQYLKDNPELAPEIENFKGDKPLNKRNEKTQIRFYKEIMQKHGDDVKDWLHKANEGKLEGPAAEIFARFDIVQKTFNQSRMGVAIIAEANAMSCVQQQALAEAFGINGMIHCALNEEEETIRNAPSNLRTYLKNFGQSNLQYRTELVKGEDGQPDMFVVVMDPASDSHKSWGIGMKEQQLKSWKNISGLGMEFATAALYKIGTGCSYARGGFPSEIVPRLHLNTLSRFVDFKSLSDQSRKILKKQMAFVSTTIQGRGPGIMRGTAQQVQDSLAKTGFGIDAACLAVDGKIDVKDVTPLAVKYSPKMTKFLDATEQDMRDHYFNEIRHEPSDVENDTTVENRYMRSVSATMMALLTNVSARKPSRDDSDGKVVTLEDKDTGGQRAIGQNVVKEWSESLPDGWGELGRFMQQTRGAFENDDIDRKDVSDLASDEIYIRHKWGNAMLALAHADNEWGFDKLASDKGTLTDQRWTVGKLLQVVNDDYTIYDPLKRETVALDEEERRHAEIAYEALVASSHMEALLNTSAQSRAGRLKSKFTRATKQKDMRLSERDIILQTYSEDDTLEKTKFGEKTKELYPEIENIQKLSQDNKVMRAMVHEGERRLREKEGQGVHLEEGSVEIQKFRHIAMARRSFGPITLPNLMDNVSVTFGARPKSAMQLLNVLADNVRRWDRTVRISNDNNTKPELAVA